MGRGRGDRPGRAPGSFQIGTFQTLTFTYNYDVSEYDSPPPVVYATTERDGATLRVTIRNLAGSSRYLVTTSGQPSLSIWSQRLASGTTSALADHPRVGDRHPQQR